MKIVRHVLFFARFLGPRGPLIEPSISARPSRPARKKNPDHLYSLINHRRTTVNLSKEKKGKREKEKKRKRKKKKRKKEKGKKKKKKRRKREKEKKDKRKKEKKRKRKKEKKKKERK